jgi:hypothetical protein
MPTLPLPVDLTDADRLVVAADLTAVIYAREQVEAQKKEVTKDFNAKIKVHKAKEHELNEALRLGHIEREVEVEERPDYARGVVETFRLDVTPNTVVKVRGIDPDERQTVMGLLTVGSKLVGVDGARTDEQRDASTPEEAEALREERLANERAERISEAVSEARGRLQVSALTVPDGEPARWQAVVQFGNHVIDETGFSEAQAVEAAVRTITELAEADEAARPVSVPTWDEVKAASEAEQRRQEVERLAAEQAADDKANKPKRLLQVPKGARKKAVEKKIKILDPDDNDLNAAPEQEPAEAGPTKTYFGTADDMRPVNDAARAAEDEKASDDAGEDLWT